MYLCANRWLCFEHVFAKTFVPIFVSKVLQIFVTEDTWQLIQSWLFFEQTENFPDMDAFAADVKGQQSKGRMCFTSFSNAFLSFVALCIFKFFESRSSSSYSKDVQRTLARFSLA